MADTLQFDLVSPERLLMSQAVQQVVVPGSEGDMTVLVDHSPVMTTLRPGVLEITTDDGQSQDIFVRGGFAEITPEGLTILAEEAIPLEKLDAADLDQRIKDLEEDVRDAKDDETRLKASDELAHLKQVRGAL